MAEKWECPDCGRRNPKARVQCYKRSCNGMPWRQKRKMIALIGILSGE